MQIKGTKRGRDSKRVPAGFRPRLSSAHFRDFFPLPTVTSTGGRSAECKMQKEEEAPPAGDVLTPAFLTYRPASIPIVKCADGCARECDGSGRAPVITTASDAVLALSLVARLPIPRCGGQAWGIWRLATRRAARLASTAGRPIRRTAWEPHHVRLTSISAK